MVCLSPPSLFPFSLFLSLSLDDGRTDSRHVFSRTGCASRALSPSQPLNSRRPKRFQWRHCHRMQKTTQATGTAERARGEELTLTHTLTRATRLPHDTSPLPLARPAAICHIAFSIMDAERRGEMKTLGRYCSSLRTAGSCRDAAKARIGKSFSVIASIGEWIETAKSGTAVTGSTDGGGSELEFD